VSIKLNVWHIQAVPKSPELPWDHEDLGEVAYEAIRFTRRNGQPETIGPYPTIEAARQACGSPDAELL
jgi:hypothetical protein